MSEALLPERGSQAIRLAAVAQEMHLKTKAREMKNAMLGKPIPDEPISPMEDFGSTEGMDKAEDDDLEEYKDIHLPLEKRPLFRTLLMVLEIAVWCTLLMMPALLLGFMKEHEKYSIIDAKPGQEGFTPNIYREFYRWSVFISASYGAYVFAMWAVGMVSAVLLGGARVFRFTVTPEFRLGLKLVKRSQKYFGVLLWLVLELVIGSVVLFWTGVAGPHLAQHLNRANTEKALLAASFVTLLLAGEKYIIQMLTNAFHRESLSRRIARNNELRGIISHLFRLSRGLNPAEIANYQAEFADAGLLELARDDVLRGLSAKTVASSIFRHLKAQDRTYLKPEDFQPFFGRPDEAKTTFRLLDGELQGKIELEPYFRATVGEILAEHDRIQEALVENGRVIRRFDNFLLVIVALLAIIGGLSLFNEKSYTLVLTMFSLLLTFSFLIKDTVTRFSDAFRLVYIERAFDVGDVIVIEGTSYTVQAIRLFTTTLVRNADKTLTYAPNHVLASKLLVNTRRLPLSADKASITAHGNVRMAVVGDLRRGMEAWAKDSFEGFTGSCSVGINEIAGGKVKISLSMSYEPTTDEKVLSRRNQFRNKLQDLLQSLGIAADPPTF